jgi:hypothetical protein
MKLLLRSGGVTNPSIHAALVELLGRPIAECHALCVPGSCPRCRTRSGWECAGNMVMTPRIGTEFLEWPAAPDDAGEQADGHLRGEMPVRG